MSTASNRPTGVTATIDAHGHAAVTASSGANAPLAYSPSMPGLNPLELLDASLAGCLAISLRVAARDLGLADRLGAVSVEVKGVKSAGPPSRIARQVCRFGFGGELSNGEKQALIAAAHELCTVGLSLDGGIDIVDGEPLD